MPTPARRAVFGAIPLSAAGASPHPPTAASFRTPASQPPGAHAKGS